MSRGGWGEERQQEGKGGGGGLQRPNSNGFEMVRSKQYFCSKVEHRPIDGTGEIKRKTACT